LTSAADPTPMPQTIVEVDKTKFSLKPAMSIHSKIIPQKHVPAGFKVSYVSIFATERPSRIATVPIGYADGYRRLLSSKGSMLVRGIAVPVVGRVCMDFTMIYATDVADAALGDDVVILGCQGNACLTADEIVRLIGTINYEVVSSLTRRMPLRHIHPKE
jgi:alanine racemase